MLFSLRLKLINIKVKMYTMVVIKILLMPADPHEINKFLLLYTELGEKFHVEAVIGKVRGLAKERGIDEDLVEAVTGQ